MKSAKKDLSGYRTGWIAILLALVFSAAARVPQVGIPFDRDEGAYAYVSDVMDRGGLPYRDAFDHKPPGIYYIYNSSFRLFGHDIRAPRILALLSVSIACFLIFLFVYRVSLSVWASVLSMGLLAWSCSSPAYAGFAANTETFILPFITGASLSLMGDKRPASRYFWPGLLFGFAVVLKQVALMIALSCFIYIAVRERKSLQRLPSVAGAFFSGLLLPFTLFTFWFWFCDAFAPFWEGFFVYNRSYASTLGFRQVLNNFLASMKFILTLDPGTWLAAYLGLSSLWKFDVKRQHKLLIFVPLAGAFLAIAIGGYFAPHYFLLLLPYFAMAAGVGGAAFSGRGVENVGKWLLTVFIIGSISIGMRFSIKSDDEKLQVVYGADLFARSLTVGRFLNSCAAKGSTAYIFGSEAQILFYSGLSTPGRLFYFYPLMQASSLRNGFRKEMISSMIVQPPDYLIRVNDPSSVALNGFIPDNFIREIEAFFSDYRAIGISSKGSNKISMDIRDLKMERRVGSIVIYRRITDDGLTRAILDSKERRYDPQ